MVERRYRPAPAGRPVPARRAADLATLGAEVAGAVAAMLRGRPREAVANAVTVLLAEPVSRAMLDAYASPARGTHNVSAARLLALTSVTGRVDVLDGLLARIGAAALGPDQLRAARLARLEGMRAALDAEIAAARGTPPGAGA